MRRHEENVTHATPYDALFDTHEYDLDDVGYLDEHDLDLLRPAASRNKRDTTLDDSLDGELTLTGEE